MLAWVPAMRTLQYLLRLKHPASPERWSNCPGDVACVVLLSSIQLFLQLTVLCKGNLVSRCEVHHVQYVPGYAVCGL